MRRMKEIIWLQVCLLLLIAGGCTQTEVEDDDIPPHALKEVEVGFNLHVLATQTPVTRSITFTPDGTIDSDTLAVGAADTIPTRATTDLAKGQESKIVSLWVGQYDAVTGNRLFSTYFDSMADNTVNIKLKKSQNGAQSHVWFVTNSGDLDAGGEIATEKVLKEHVLAYSSGETGLPSSNLCGMSGYWEGVVKEGGVENITVELTRLVAKITFIYAIGGDGFSFTPSSVRLNSVPDKSQVTAPTAQLSSDVSYKTYSGTADAGGATMYWYLPENMAGTASGKNFVDSEKEKIGKGVTNATYIELTGTSVQSGVTYEGVKFRFYPGGNKNNYDIIRNSHYTMSVTLVGIDISDQRITVGTIPPITVDTEKMPATKGGTKEVQITARPGQPWSFDLEQWLSAVIDGKTGGTGTQISSQGPAKVLFKAESANTKAEDRSVTFSVNVSGTPQKITITQSGSTLEKGADISLDAASDSEGSSSFTATAGLSWQAALSGEDWWSWTEGNPVTSGAETTGSAQSLNVKATSSNPLATARSGKITVKVGASVGDINYTALKKEINVTQAGSTVSSSTVTVEPVAAENQTSSFTATAGLDWAAKVTTGDWLTLGGTSSGAANTTGNPQDVTFSVTVNPTSSQRSGAIAVRAGDATNGPTGTITVNQKASELTAAADNLQLAATAGADGTLTFKGTSGLSFSATAPDWLTLTGTTSGTTNGNEQNFAYKTSNLNLNGTVNTGNISVTAGEMVQNVAVSQIASTFSVVGAAATIDAAGGNSIGSVTATEGLAWTVFPEKSEDITVSPTSGSGDATLTFAASANSSVERTGTFYVTVTGASPARTEVVMAKQAAEEIGVCIEKLQVCKTDDVRANWSTADANCKSSTKEGKSDWRLPDIEELKIMYQKRSDLESNADFNAFQGNAYWSGTVEDAISHKVVYFGKYVVDGAPDSAEAYVRCVRDK